MTTGRREQLRQIMRLAWQKLRWEQDVRGLAYTLSQALRHAWAWFKGEAIREAEQKAAKATWATSRPQVTHLRSIIRSPIRRGLTGQRYAGSTDYRAAYTTARLGI